MNSIQGPVFIDGIVNSIVAIREDRPKSFVVRKTIDAVREMILEDRNVIYCEITTTLGVSETRLYSI